MSLGNLLYFWEERGLLKILCYLIRLKGNVDFLGAPPTSWEGDRCAMKGFSSPMLWGFEQREKDSLGIYVHDARIISRIQCVIIMCRLSVCTTEFFHWNFLL